MPHISDLSTGATTSHLKAIERRYLLAEEQLLAILIDMERRLLGAFASAPILEAGGLTLTNSANIQQALAQYTAEIDAILFAQGSAGAAWIDTYANLSTAAGVERVQKTLALAEDLAIANTLPLRTGLQNFAAGEAEGVLALGRGNLTARLIEHRDDTVKFLQREYTRAAVEGVATVGPGDTLANRIFEGGRLKDLEITTSGGVQRVITAETRAKSFARTELNRIETDSTIQQATALGMDLYLDAGPDDERTSDICLAALEFGGDTPRTLEEWEESGIGITPRHVNCRHRLVPVREEWV